MMPAGRPHAATCPLGAQAPVPDDLQIIERVLEGDVDCFAELIARHREHVAKIVNRHVPPECVEEVAHDVFVRAFTGLAGYSAAVPFEHWLSGIAVRACYDFWRAARRHAVPISALTEEHDAWIERVLTVESDAQFQAETGRREAREVLRWALSRLSPENRLVLALVHLEGYSVREAAKLLGWSVANVKVRAYRARRALQRLFSAEERDHDQT
jgi:RNA polymerase sigma-70 factor (ECF subfamily)